MPWCILDFEFLTIIPEVWLHLFLVQTWSWRIVVSLICCPQQFSSYYVIDCVTFHLDISPRLGIMNLWLFASCNSARYDMYWFLYEVSLETVISKKCACTNHITLWLSFYLLKRLFLYIIFCSVMATKHVCWHTYYVVTLDSFQKSLDIVRCKKKKSRATTGHNILLPELRSQKGRIMETRPRSRGRSRSRSPRRG